MDTVKKQKTAREILDSVSAKFIARYDWGATCFSASPDTRNLYQQRLIATKAICKAVRQEFTKHGVK